MRVSVPILPVLFSIHICVHASLSVYNSTNLRSAVACSGNANCRNSFFCLNDPQCYLMLKKRPPSEGGVSQLSASSDCIFIEVPRFSLSSETRCSEYWSHGGYHKVQTVDGMKWKKNPKRMRFCESIKATRSFSSGVSFWVVDAKLKATSKRENKNYFVCFLVEETYKTTLFQTEIVSYIHGPTMCVVTSNSKDVRVTHLLKNSHFKGGEILNISLGFLLDWSRHSLDIINLNGHVIVDTVTDLNTSAPIWPYFGKYPNWNIELKIRNFSVNDFKFDKRLLKLVDSLTNE